MRTRPGDDIPRWKIALAAGVVGAVAATVVSVALLRGLLPLGAAEDTRTLPSGIAPAAAASPVATERARMIASVEAALDAWEAFARSADLDDVEEAFVVGGPQYLQFQREMRSGRAGIDQVPGFSLRTVSAVDSVGHRREVLTRVALTAEGAEPDIREWAFLLEPVGGSWRVWTVVDRSGGA